MTKKINTRNSGVELLRIVAILLIVMSHCLPFYGSPSCKFYVNLNLATKDINHLIMIFIKYFGQIGNCVFIVISSYYLIDNNYIKWDKVKQIIFDSFIFSFVILIICILCGVNVSSKTLLQQLLPITFQGCWFVGCYLFLYLLHPFINLIIKKSNKLDLLRITTILVVLYSVLPNVFGDYKYYNNFLIGFITIYFVTAYFKLYLKKSSDNLALNIKFILIGVAVILFLISFTNILGNYYDMFNNKMLKWNVFSNPFIIILSIGLFNCFKKLRFYSNRVNTIASLTLYIYMIHENPLIRDNFKPWIFNVLNDYNIWLCILFLNLLTLIFCIPISYVYLKLFQNHIYFIFNNLINKFKFIYKKIENYLMKITRVFYKFNLNIFNYKI